MALSSERAEAIWEERRALTPRAGDTPLVAHWQRKIRSWTERIETLDRDRDTGTITDWQWLVRMSPLSLGLAGAYRDLIVERLDADITICDRDRDRDRADERWEYVQAKCMLYNEMSSLYCHEGDWPRNRDDR